MEKNFLQQHELFPKIQEILKINVSSQANFKVPISQPLAVQRMLLEYANQDIKRRISEISDTVPLYRKSRGDGNCFYRAFFFYYAEKIISEQSSQSLSDCVKQLQNQQITLQVLDQESLDFQELDKSIQQDYQIVDQIFIEGITLLHRLQQSQNLSRSDLAYYLLLLVTEIPAFDMAGILYVRMVAADGLQRYAEQLAPYTFDLQRPPIQLAKTYGTEGELVIALAVAMVLNVNINAMELKKGGNNGWQISPEMLLENRKGEYDVYLFYRQGHYDLCYAKSEVVQNYQRELEDEEGKVKQIQDQSRSQNERCWQCRVCGSVRGEHEQQQYDGVCGECTENNKTISRNSKYAQKLEQLNIFLLDNILVKSNQVNNVPQEITKELVIEKQTSTYPSHQSQSLFYSQDGAIEQLNDPLIQDVQQENSKKSKTDKKKSAIRESKLYCCNLL